MEYGLIRRISVSVPKCDRLNGQDFPFMRPLATRRNDDPMQPCLQIRISSSALRTSCRICGASGYQILAIRWRVKEEKRVQMHISCTPAGNCCSGTLRYFQQHCCSRAVMLMVFQLRSTAVRFGASVEGADTRSISRYNMSSVYAGYLITPLARLIGRAGV